MRYATDESSTSIKALVDSQRCCKLSPDPARFPPGTHSQVDLNELATTSGKAVGLWRLWEAVQARALGCPAVVDQVSRMRPFRLLAFGFGLRRV